MVPEANLKSGESLNPFESRVRVLSDCKLLKSASNFCNSCIKSLHSCVTDSLNFTVVSENSMADGFEGDSRKKSRGAASGE